ncbi:MAG: LysM peptidoglycan-binding domain-containing protein [Elusimicrobiales bacterium]|nr:LysM peptidoglycan-binding domain-containing protein [Elusimicrobiales bacterium]
MPRVPAQPPAAPEVPVKAAVAKPAASKSAAVQALPVAPAAPAAPPSPKVYSEPLGQSRPAGAPVPAVKPAQQARVEPLPQPVPGAGFAVVKTHTVTGGDTLWDLSSRYYSDPFKWGRIYNANLGVVANPDRIYPKNELVIPDITEEVRPEVKQPIVITGGETVKEAELLSADVEQPQEEPAQVNEAPPVVPVFKPASAQLQEALDAYDRADLSDEMPKHQKEWASGIKIVPQDWREDGVITGKEVGRDESMEDSLSMSGAMVSVDMEDEGARPGDYLAVYLKGSTAYDKSGKKLGLEVQRAGTLQVVSADGAEVRARVISAVTAISKGYVVKKK